MKKLAALFSGICLLGAGCQQCSSVFDGIMAQPLSPTDLPAWYHLGGLMAPVLGHFIQIGLILLGGLIGNPVI